MTAMRSQSHLLPSVNRAGIRRVRGCVQKLIRLRMRPIRGSRSVDVNKNLFDLNSRNVNNCNCHRLYHAVRGKASEYRIAEKHARLLRAVIST